MPQGQVPGFARPGAAEVNVVVDEFTQSEGDRKEQPSIGHQAVVVEGDVDAVSSFGCSSFRVGLVSAKPLSILLSLRWIGVYKGERVRVRVKV